jgi:hypothetical protein
MSRYDEGAPLDEKYITFKRQEFLELVSPEARNFATSKALYDKLLDLALPDAVVIRRQDYFASPALNAYASCIAIAARFMNDDLVRQGELLAIADYFHQQAELSGDEAWKLPDL